MDQSHLQRLLALLDATGLPYLHTRHPPATGSAHIAQLRGAERSLGVKSMLVKADKTFLLACLRTNRELDNRALRRGLGVSKLRFARREELAELTGGLVPGQVPPVGEPLLPLPLVADESVWGQARMAFTCGTHTDSIELDVGDWARLANPRRLGFSRPMAG